MLELNPPFRAIQRRDGYLPLEDMGLIGDGSTTALVGLDGMISYQIRTISDVAAEIGNVDVVFEAAGHSGFAFEVLKVLGVKGIYVLTGAPGQQAFLEADQHQECDRI
jgi:threonine dehydrogenase-like Zn-dependent dehydrogenase